MTEGRPWSPASRVSRFLVLSGKKPHLSHKPETGNGAVLTRLLIEVEHIREIPNGRTVGRHIGIGRICSRVGQVVAAAAGDRGKVQFFSINFRIET